MCKLSSCLLVLVRTVIEKMHCFALTLKLVFTVLILCCFWDMFLLSLSVIAYLLIVVGIHFVSLFFTTDFVLL